jgi:hypothetical protein
LEDESVRSNEKTPPAAVELDDKAKEDCADAIYGENAEKLSKPTTTATLQGQTFSIK